MLWSTFIAFAAGALMALFSVFGFVHLRRTAPKQRSCPSSPPRSRPRPHTEDLCLCRSPVTARKL
jgi:hypothetical protein